MDTNNTTLNYQESRTIYYKVFIGLMLLTALTFVQPYMFMKESTFGAQMAIAVAKAWLIIMYYMHLKGEKLISVMGIFSLLIVATFFVIVIGFDVAHFQFGPESYITGTENAGAGHTAPGHH